MSCKYFFIFISVALVFGCAEEKKDIDLSSLIGSGGSVPFTGNPWFSNCDYTARAKGIQFTGSNYSEALFIFTDNTCSTLSYVIESTGSYVVTPDPASFGMSFTDGKIDKTVSTYAITPQSVAAANSMNSGHRCGYNDWAVGITKDVTGLICGEGMRTIGSTEYDIYSYSFTTSLWGNAGDMMFGLMDSSLDGTSSAKRPTTFNGNFVFRKQ